MSKPILTKSIRIQAPIEKVFDCFTKAEAMLSWHGKEVETNPEPGGIYRVVFEDGTIILGKFTEVDYPHRLVYEASYGSVSSAVSINLSFENGETLVELTQEFEPGQDISSFKGGWDYFLGLLKDHLE